MNRLRYFCTPILCNIRLLHLLKANTYHVGFEILTAVAMKVSIFWDFCKLPASCWCSSWLTLRPWKWRRYVHLNVCWLSPDYVALYHRVHKFLSKYQTRNNYSGCHLLTCCFFLKLFSSTLKMEAICSSETLVATHQATRRHIPEDDTLHYHRCENLKS
jgi:hypothetical protein